MAGIDILVVCTGNSCRSQIAQGYLERLAGDRLTVRSAGTEPAERVHPLAVRVMGEQGIDISEKRPRDYRDYLGRVEVRYLITVCDGAAESCPAVWPGARERLHWPFEDPAAFEGDEEATVEKFREVRDAMEARILSWLATL